MQHICDLLKCSKFKIFITVLKDFYVSQGRITKNNFSSCLKSYKTEYVKLKLKT